MLDSQLIQILFFVGFVVVILALLFFDLGVLEKKDKVVSLKRAVVTTLIWAGLAVVFGMVIRFAGNQMHGIEDKQTLIEEI